MCKSTLFLFSERLQQEKSKSKEAIREADVVKQKEVTVLILRWQIWMLSALQVFKTKEKNCSDMHRLSDHQKKNLWEYFTTLQQTEAFTSYESCIYHRY